jgi:hypothetical protein
MRHLLLIAFAATCLAAQAADDKKLTPQQEKMAACNKDAADKKGDERKAFMKTCLAKKETQQDKMKRCNVQAEGKTGDERKQYMSNCLKAAPKA